MTIKTFIRMHAVLSYYALTFVISWGGVLILGAPHGMPTTSDQFTKLWPIVFLPYFFGPSIASILLIAFVYGKAGFRELFSRLLRLRVGIHWYMVALLTAPLLVTLILLTLSLTSPVFLPAIFTADDKVGLLLSGLAVGLIFGGFLEELGWTGFATPELQRRYSIVTTGLIVGFLHAAWHFLPTFWGSGDASGALDLLLLLPPCLFYIGVLPSYRVMMVWIYNRTTSLFVAMLMHASLTASTLFILSPAARGIALITYYLVLIIVMWIVVAAVAVTTRGQLSRRPSDENRGHPNATLQTSSHGMVRQPIWQHIILLSIFGYERAGALLGGGLLVAAPDGRLMDMPVDIMQGVFSSFLIPGLILISLGILASMAFVAVLRRIRTDWLLTCLALGGLAIWFTVEIIILQDVHWLHAMWGLPVLVGCLLALPFVSSRQVILHRSKGV